MAEREIYNPETGEYEMAYDPGIYDPGTTDAPAPAAPTRTRYDWWSDPDTDPPDWMLQPGQPPVQATPGYYWSWSGDHWAMLPAPTATAAPTGTPPPTGGDTTPDPLPTTYGGDPYAGGMPTGPRMQLSALNYPQFNGPKFQAPAPFQYDPFQEPTIEEAQKEPGFEYALNQGIKAYENSKAYLGTYRSGATIKGLNDYARNMASQNYGQVYSRKADTYDRNRNNAASNYATNYGISRDVFDRDYMGAKDTYAPQARAAELQFARDWDQYAYEGDDAYRRWKAVIDANAT